MHCVGGYPAPTQGYNLRTIAGMRDRFALVTGAFRPRARQRHRRHQRGDGRVAVAEMATFLLILQTYAPSAVTEKPPGRP